MPVTKLKMFRKMLSNQKLFWEKIRSVPLLAPKRNKIRKITGSGILPFLFNLIIVCHSDWAKLTRNSFWILKSRRTARIRFANATKFYIVGLHLDFSHACKIYLLYLLQAELKPVLCRCERRWVKTNKANLFEEPDAWVRKRISIL